MSRKRRIPNDIGGGSITAGDALGAALLQSRLAGFRAVHCLPDNPGLHD